ncbi:hypothetical protein [Photobacterium lipolyticum]|uniref:Uncharacterized protein n=1 Tax=Photobacterium lipolyticum TaxID=266810 RepID=A0A2T3MV61_9GAMM|nr:hypothetical protein [Photobacterium lipolyticum]PSW03861.1 hypothetical protein C9I89_15835 [Photobacterium lipolyticum]
MKSLSIIEIVKSALFIGVLVTTFNSAIPHLAMALFLLLLTLLNRDINKKVSFLYLIPLMIFFISLINTLIYLNINVDANSTMMIFRARKYFFELIVSYSIIFFCLNTNEEKVLKLIYNAIVISVVVGVAEFIADPTERPSMLFLEPSSAGYFIGTFIFLVFYQNKFTVRALFITSLVLLRSKSMIFSMFVAFVVHKFDIKKYILVLFLITISGGAIHEYLMDNSGQYFGFVHLVETLYRYGIDGFSASHGIYNTYLTRLSGILLGVDTLIDKPFGIGFGSFHEIYASKLFNYFTISDIGDEVLTTFTNGGMVTPKSNLIEQFLNAGILGCAFFIFYLKSIMKGKDVFFRTSVICFVILSLVTELNNFYLYMLLLAYFSKGNSFDKRKSV